MHRSSSKRWLLRACGLVLGVALCPLSVAAAPVDPAAALVERGLELRQARRDDDALAAFEEAYQAQQSPMILAQIALAEQALGRFVDAELHLTESLRRGGDWIDQRRVALETALRAIQSRLGWLEVGTNATDAELWLDERALPLSSSPFRVTAGSHTLRLRTPGGSSAERAVELRGGERHVYRLELAELPPPPLSPVPSPSAPPPLAPKEHRPTNPPHRGSRAWAYATAAVAGVALVEAVAASLLRQSYVDDYNGPACAPDRSERCAPFRKSANLFGTVAVVSYAVAGAAGVTSVALFTEPWWNASHASSSGAVVGVAGAF